MREEIKDVSRTHAAGIKQAILDISSHVDVSVKCLSSTHSDSFKDAVNAVNKHVDFQSKQAVDIVSKHINS